MASVLAWAASRLGQSYPALLGGPNARAKDDAKKTPTTTATPPTACGCERSTNGDDASTTPPPLLPITLCLPGYGILFFHQLGMLAHLRDRGLFSSQPPLLEGVVGSSAGGLAAVLAACGVCPLRAVGRAHALCERAGLYGRPGDGFLARALRPCALAGRWGGLVREWLEALLPPDAHERAEAGRVALAVTRVAAPPRTERLASFASRDALIEAAAASAHVPLFMDGRLAAETRWGHLVDGSFLHLFLGAGRGGLVPPETCGGGCANPRPVRRVVVLDPFADPNLGAWGWLRCLALPTLEGAQALVEAGRARARELERQGAFEGILTPVPAAKGELTALANGGGSSSSLASWTVGAGGGSSSSE